MKCFVWPIKTALFALYGNNKNDLALYFDWFISWKSYLLHGADEILSWFVDVTPYRGRPPSRVGVVGTVMATHLNCVTGFRGPTQLIVHDKVDRRNI